MFAKLESLERKFLDLEQELADPTVFNDQDRYRKLTKAHSDLKPVVDIFRQYRELKQNLADNQELLNDADRYPRNGPRRNQVHREKLPELEYDLKVLLLPPTRWTKRTSFWKSAPVRAAKRPSSAAIFSVCTAATPKRWAGKSKS